MRIGVNDNIYRPYSVVVNNRGYYLDNIHFYNEDGVVVSSGWGWLTRKGGSDIQSIELPVEKIKLRRKPKFDGAVFAMLHKDWNETKAELYIPCDMFGIHFTCNKLVKRIWQVYKVYDGEQGIHIEQHVFSIDGKLTDVRAKYDELHKDCESYKLISNSDKVAANLDRMRELTEDYRTELARLNSLTIDDIDVDDIDV